MPRLQSRMTRREQRMTRANRRDLRDFLKIYFSSEFARKNQILLGSRSSMSLARNEGVAVNHSAHSSRLTYEFAGDTVHALPGHRSVRNSPVAAPSSN